MSRKGGCDPESRLDFPNIWMLRDVSAAIEPKDVVILLFCGTLSRVENLKKSRKGG